MSGGVGYYALWTFCFASKIFLVLQKINASWFPDWRVKIFLPRVRRKSQVQHCFWLDDSVKGHGSLCFSQFVCLMKSGEPNKANNCPLQSPWFPIFSNICLEVKGKTYRDNEILIELLYFLQISRKYLSKIIFSITDMKHEKVEKE